MKYMDKKGKIKNTWNGFRVFTSGPKWTRTTDLTLIRRAL